MDIECTGKGFTFAREGTELICKALTCLKDKLAQERAKMREDFPFEHVDPREYECESLINCFSTMVPYGYLEVMPAKKNTPLWTKQDEIIERQELALRHILMNIGRIPLNHREEVDVWKNILAACKKGLGARKAVLAEKEEKVVLAEEGKKEDSKCK